MTAPKTTYCIDASALIELRGLDSEVFHGVWEALDELAASEIIHAPKEVLREITRFDTVISRWAISKKHIFFIPDQALLDKVIEVQKAYKFYDPETDVPKADPFLVAHAILTGCTIVTQETFNKKNRPGPKIPEACRHFNCRFIDLTDFFKEQGLTFVGKKSNVLKVVSPS